jgi:hypothetical protein
VAHCSAWLDLGSTLVEAWLSTDGAGSVCLSISDSPLCENCSRGTRRCDYETENDSGSTAWVGMTPRGLSLFPVACTPQRIEPGHDHLTFPGAVRL